MTNLLDGLAFTNSRDGIELSMSVSHTHPDAVRITFVTATEMKALDVIESLRSEFRGTSFTPPVQAKDGKWVTAGRVWGHDHGDTLDH